ncbi:hypothetical protein C7999DRAFT_45054 [Corynascus novoguineensis]|uniref:Aminoglycoside phosphotransferase domain-containing protein n=1 Tax=Corynascus novoguineensis TaxID=1126955 RepID=A0AAN7CKN5_9PEZI|nr:hypothetical protein C7999DRAFT_45054 [Corynascus novoguineensis]
MSSSQTAAVPFTIENVLPGPLAFPSSPDVYRIRLQREHAAGGPTIKYLAAPNTVRVFTGPDAYHRRLTNLAFDCVPAGDWVVGRLSAAERGGETKLELISTAGADTLLGLSLVSAGPVWCGMTVDEADCAKAPPSMRWTTVVDAAGAEVRVPKLANLQCMDYVSASVIPAPQAVVACHYPGQEEEACVVLVSDWFPGHWVGIDNETRAYRMIQERDPGLAPRFLAHVTENGSHVVGFLLEYVPDAREAGPADLDRCSAVLGRLHALGIAKRGLSRHSFLVKGDGEVLVRGPFDGPPEEAKTLAKSPSEFEDQATRMLRLADPQRAKLLGEFQEAHGFVLPFVYWLEERTGRITLTVEEYSILAKEYEDNGFAWSRELQERAEKRFGLSGQGI